MTGLIIYLTIGAIITLYRLWIIIRFKIGCRDGIRWKIFWLTEFIIENILIWPIEIGYVTYLIIRGSMDQEWLEEFIIGYFNTICEEDE